MNYKLQFELYVSRFELKLKEKLSFLEQSAPSIIKETIKYATSDGGKRIRPVLLYATCDALDVPLDYADVYALALEFIHSYSLVHDDLECMDNDDYRRGKHSTHKKYGEALGVLCGDALLNLAFETVLSKEDFTILDKNALKILADFSGYNGMIAGQVLDILAEKDEDCSIEKFIEIYLNKTSKLLTAPLLIASSLANNKYFDLLKDVGENLGVMFQISDDILDVEGSLGDIGKTPGKDEKENKMTSIKVLGLDGAKEFNDKLFSDTIRILDQIPNTEFLKNLIESLYNRKK